MNYCCRLPCTWNTSSWVWEATVFLLLLHKSLGVLTTQSGLTGEWHLPDTSFFAAIPLQRALRLLSFKPEINCYKWLNTAEEQWIRKKNWAAQRCSKFSHKEKVPLLPTARGIHASRGDTLPVVFIIFIPILIIYSGICHILKDSLSAIGSELLPKQLHPRNCVCVYIYSCGLLCKNILNVNTGMSYNLEGSVWTLLVTLTFLERGS